MTSYGAQSASSYNGSMQNNYGTTPYGASPHPNQQQAQQQPQMQQPQLQQQQQPQQVGVNAFYNSVQPPAPQQPPPTPPQQQMALVSAQPGPQSTSQWSVQPPQQQHFVQQQPAQNLGMHGVNGQYVTPIPPFKAPMGQGQGQVTPHSYSNTPSYQSNPGVQQQQQMQTHQPHQPQPQPKTQPQPPASAPNPTDDFFGSFSSQPQRSNSTNTTETYRPTTVIQTDTTNGDYDSVSLLSRGTAERSRTRSSGSSGNRRLNPLDDPKFAPRPPRIQGLDHAKSIAAHAPPGAGGLPDFDKVSHSGYSLARISFRSILIKKWKQIFWVSYGASKILVFRSHADFEDWAANPYLTSAQRDFLVKLEVDFVEDAYKVNVRGYQVTSVRCKNYNSQLLHQFKLERWMDYGPTIAAAFASHSENDVNQLRIIINEMMKRCPQDSQLAMDAQKARNLQAHEIHHARTYDSVNHANGAHNYDGGVGRNYMSGSASTGNLSEAGSIRSSRTMRSYGAASTGRVERLKNSIRDSAKSLPGLRK